MKELLAILISSSLFFFHSPTKDDFVHPHFALNDDTLIIKEKCAVVYSPDSSRIEKRKKEIGEENFYIGADDYSFSLNSCSELFKKNDLREVDTDKPFIKFIRSNHAIVIVSIDSLPELWGIYFFSPDKDPKLIDMTDVGNEFNHYFH